MLRLANQHYRDAMHEWNTYREKTIGGAESLKSDLELVRDVSFAVALAAGAVVAAPVVAGAVATAGVTGATATVLTAGGTALVTGAGGAALGGGSTALGSYTAEGKVDWKETKKQAARFGKQGAVTGLTAGLGSVVGGAGKAAELAKPVVQQAVRRCLTEAGINVTGEITAEALDKIAPTEEASDNATGPKQVLPGPARAALVGCVGGALGVPTSKLRSGTGKVTDVAVGAGVSYADARLQGRTHEEAVLAATQSAVTSHAIGLEPPTGPEPAPKAAGVEPRHPAEQLEAAAPVAGVKKDGGTAKPESGPPRRAADQPEPPGPATSVKKESSKAKQPTVNGHEVIITSEGIGVCSPPPCPVIHVEYAKELAANPELKKAYDRLQAARKNNPERAVVLADALVRNLERVRANTRTPLAPPPFATPKQREQIETLVDQAAKLSGGSVKAEEFNKYLQSAKTPQQLDAMIAHMQARIEERADVRAALARTDHRPGSPAKQRTGRATHEQVLGVGMEAEGGAVPLDHDRHHIAPKRGGGVLGERIQKILREANVSVDDPANGIPLAGNPRDPRAVHKSSSPHSKAHNKYLLQTLLRDLETVRGDPDGIRAVLRRHGQDRYEDRGSFGTGEFRLGPDFEEP